MLDLGQSPLDMLLWIMSQFVRRFEAAPFRLHPGLIFDLWRMYREQKNA
jgi:hypothetical protein